MKTKILKEENKNFLNNQNYILGKAEKKKLLNKYFIEKNILFFYLIFNAFRKSINFDQFLILIFLSIPLFLFIIFTTFNILLGLASVFLFIFLSSIILNYKENFLNSFYDTNNISFKDLFISKKDNFLTYIIFLSIMLVGPIYLNSNSTVWFMYREFYIYGSYIFIALFFYFKKYTFELFRLRLIQILLFPLILSGFLLIGIYNFINIFLFKRGKGFKLIKYKVFGKVLNKFDYIGKKYAENKYYKIIEK